MDDAVSATRQDLVAQLRRGRGRLGMTQADLADALDISRATVVKLEAAEPSPVLDNLIRALDMVGVKLLAVPGDDPLALASRHPAVAAPKRVNRA